VQRSAGALSSMNISADLTPAQKTYLDFVRALGAQLVLLGHAAHYMWPQNFLANGAVQTIGVFIFFLISGFLISYSVFTKRHDPTYDFGSFFIDRFCRIYSAFLPALILVAIIDGLIVADPAYQWRRDFNLQTWIGNLLMLQDFPVFQVLRRLGMHDSPWMIAEFGSARPFWTISIEWWIYMLFGGIVFFCVRRGGRIGWGTLFVLGLVAIEPLYHFVGGFDNCLTILWIVGLGASVFQISLPRLAARGALPPSRRLYWISMGTAAAGTLFVVGRLFSNKFHTTELQLGLFFAIVVFGLFFALGCVKAEVPRFLGWALGFAAAYSYSLYLIHHTFLEYAAVRRPDLVGSAGSFWLMVGVSNLLAIAFWFMFERHYRHFARWAKMLRRKARSAPAASAVS